MADDLVRQAEMVTLGAMMLDPSAIDAVSARLRSTDFADVHHGSIFAAITANHAAGAETGPVGIAIALNAVKELQRVGGALYLHELIACVPTAANAGWHANVVAEAAKVRVAVADAVRFKQIAEDGDLGQIEAERARLVESWTRRTGGDVGQNVFELDALLGEPDAEYDWLVARLIERGDRLIVTGEEGKGKSTLLRQIGVQAACGIHPFNGTDIAPLRVFFLDLENGRRHTKRELRTLRLAAGDRYKPEPGMHVECRPQGIDLLNDGEGRWLVDTAVSVSPDLFITGPLYKLASGDPTEERTARTVALWLDRVRRDAECALLLEAHTPYPTNGRKRPERPYGASLWSRWPEFGIFLSPEGHLRHWRGQRDERDWPAALQRGGAWPWTPVTRTHDLLWARIVELCADRVPGERELASLTGASKSSIHRVIDAHRAEWERLTSAQVTGGGPDESLV